MITDEKYTLHESLRDHSEPVVKLETERFHVRIDKMPDDSYRYCAWNKGKDLALPPSIVILKGVRESDGNGGNYYYEFINGSYVYHCRIDVLFSPMDDPNTPPISLTVSRGEQVLVNEKIMKYFY